MATPGGAQLRHPTTTPLRLEDPTLGQSIQDVQLTGVRVLERLSQLNTSPDLAQDINVFTLRYAMPLRFDRTTIRHFANPSIASGCIKLLKVAVSRATCTDSESPLGYEYGMSCIRIIITCLEVCLLERLGEVDETLAIGDNNPQLPIGVTFSTIAAAEVDNQLSTLNDIEDYDWSSSTNQRRCTPLLAPGDALDLMNILWDDRWFLLMDLGLSSILFALFQYISHEYHRRNSPNGITLYDQLYELTARMLLAANKRDQMVALRILAECSEHRGWTFTSKHTDVLDSKLIMTAFIRQISQGLDSKALNLAAESPLKMLEFVVSATDPGSQDLLPEVIECTINIGWSWLLDQDDQIELSPDLLFGTLGMLIKPTHIPPYQLLPSVQAQIIDTVRSADLLDLTAQVILQLDPTKPDITSVTFEFMLCFYESLDDAVSGFALGQKFWDYVPVWRKFENHLYTSRYGMTSVTNSERDNHFRLCMAYWLAFARNLGLEPAIHNYADDECISERCPCAQTGGARFSCAKCSKAKYCDAQCQAMDWRFGCRTLPHSRLCRCDLG